MRVASDLEVVNDESGRGEGGEGSGGGRVGGGLSGRYMLLGGVSEWFVWCCGVCGGV